MSAPVEVDADQALAGIDADSRVYVQGGASHPDALAAALVCHARQGRKVEVVTSVLGPVPIYCDAGLVSQVSVKSFRGLAQARAAYDAGQFDVVPAGLSRIPSLLRGPLRPDATLIQVSEPDRRGWCSLGVNVLYHHAAIDAARVVIAEVNPQLPRTFGDGAIHLSQIDRIVRVDRPLTQFASMTPSEPDLQAAQLAAGYVEDGMTVQVGMGSLAEAVLQQLRSRRGLRIHAGLLSDGLVDLVEAGAVLANPGSITVGALAGTDRLYDFVRENPLVSVRRVEHTHSTAVLAAAAPLVAINSAIEVDTTGQVNSEAVRGLPVSGPGGALDFAYGASSSGGLSIVALTSVDRKGRHQRIVDELASPGVVSVPRTEVDVLVTEHGAVDLRGLTLRERASSVAALGCSVEVS